MTVLLVVNTPPYGSEGSDGFLDRVRAANIRDLSEAVARCERTLSF
jgi:sulfur relay (sulfurtransferase) complex TusBCD TusD component (DsrE family)